MTATLTELFGEMRERLAGPPEPWRGPVSLSALFDGLAARLGRTTKMNYSRAAVDARVERRIRELVAAAPPPTERTRARLAELLS